MGLVSDAQLLQLVRSGSRPALAALYGRHLPAVWRFVYARLRGNDPASQDVVSETFLAAIRDIARVNPATGVGPWLMGIARHKLADDKRRRARESGTMPEDEAVADLPGPAAAADAAETRQIVASILDRIDDIERLALEWKYIDELSVRQIAQRLGKTEKAVEAMLYRARTTFRGLYEAVQQPER